MREILFRGKRRDNGEWVEGAFCSKNSDGPFSPMKDDPSIIKLDKPHDGYWFAVDGDTVGQYTGLKDKNGKRIFEGDILKDDWGKIFKVFFATYSCAFMCEHTQTEWEAGDYRIGETWCDTIRVIGNIYDNPELMGGDV